MRKAKAAAPLKKISRGEIYVFKVKNRRSYAAICKDNLCEGTTPQQAMRRLYHPLRRMGYELVLSGLIAALSASPVWAREATAVKQVKIESRIVEASDSFSKELGVDYLLFHQTEGRDTKADIAVVVNTQPGQKTKVEASILSYGRGADFRRIETQNPMLVVYPEVSQDGGIQMRLRPEKTEITHISKSSVASVAAPFLFAALGSQYEGPGAQAASNPGQVCPVTGKPTGGGEEGSSGVHGAIDKVGMTAGMGLLASQAKGQLDGLKAQWTLDPMTHYKFDVKFDAYNKNTRKTENLTQTVTIESPAMTKGLVAEFAGVQYKAKDTAEHKDFTLITGIDVKREGDKTRIDVLSDLRPRGGPNDWELGKVNIGVGGDLTYKHHWDDFDETGHCYDCDFYEPFADEDNYDDDGFYIGPPLSVKLKVLETALEIVENNQTLRSVFVSNVPVIRTLFTTEVKNKKTRELVVFVRPYILKPSDSPE